MRKILKFVYGATRGLFVRLILSLLSGERKIIKMTGMGNREAKVCFYPSFLHFLHNVPSYFQKRRYDYLVAQNFLGDSFLSCHTPKLFYTLEPFPYMTAETLKNMRSESIQPYLYLYDEPDIRRRMFYPALPVRREEIIKRLERNCREKRLKLCCIISRYAENPGLNLLEQRVRFVRAMGADIDIYGAEPWSGPNKWRAFPNYYGRTDDKQRTLRVYNFVIAFENVDYPGYITEKIMDAFQAGTVPLYWGGGEFLKETIPPDCYIDCRSKDPEEIYRMIHSMPQEDIVSYRNAAVEFLKSDAAERFTREYFKQQIVERLREME